MESQLRSDAVGDDDLFPKAAFSEVEQNEGSKSKQRDFKVVAQRSKTNQDNQYFHLAACVIQSGKVW